MAKDTFIQGKRCRWYSSKYLWISDDGYLAAISDKNNKNNPTGKKILKISIDSHGKKYIDHPYGITVYVENAVITCFCPPAPQDGKAYEINHRDGNLSNCHYKNLEWTPYHYHHATTDIVKLEMNSKTLTIYKDGTVKVSGKEVDIYDSFYDPDVDLEVCSWGPFFYMQGGGLNRVRIFLDDLMKKAGFVEGDDSKLSSPKILHKDNDYMNCSSENLEWVEETDDKYSAFLKQRKADTYNKTVRNNPGKTLPKNL